jgi:hypothetical protein
VQQNSEGSKGAASYIAAKQVQDLVGIWLCRQLLEAAVAASGADYQLPPASVAFWVLLADCLLTLPVLRARPRVACSL